VMELVDMNSLGLFNYYNFVRSSRIYLINIFLFRYKKYLIFIFFFRYVVD
jgi:hypothetical protein